MSIFIPVPNNKMRVKCTICNNEVSKAEEGKKMEMHQQYHVLGDQMLSNTETACPLCLTPMSIRGQSFVKHLEGFHKISHKKALEMNTLAVLDAKNRNIQMPKPTFKLPQAVQNQVQEKAEEVAKRRDEKNQRNPDALLPRGRPRKVPNLQGESDIERERRLNRQAVQKFRAKVREQRGLPAPKTYNRTLLEGETQEQREKRLNRERVKKYREAQKAKKANQ